MEQCVDNNTDNMVTQPCEECVSKERRIKSICEIRDDSMKKMKEGKNETINFFKKVIFAYIGFRVGCSVANYLKEK